MRTRLAFCVRFLFIVQNRSFLCVFIIKRKNIEMKTRSLRSNANARSSRDQRVDDGGFEEEAKDDESMNEDSRFVFLVF